jgi:hypothetical protein
MTTVPGGGLVPTTPAPRVAAPRDRDPKRPRTMSEFTYALRPTSAKYSHATTAPSAAAPPPASATALAADVEREADAGNVVGAISAARALASYFLSPTGPTPTAGPDVVNRAAAGTSVDPDVPLEPSERFMQLQYFLTYLYSQISGASYIPPADVSWTSDQILVDDPYYGDLITAHRHFKLFAGRDKDRIPSIEDIARNPDSVLYDAFVGLAVGFSGKARERSKDTLRAKYGFTSREYESTRDLVSGHDIAVAAVDIFLGRTDRSGIGFLKPRV